MDLMAVVCVRDFLVVRLKISQIRRRTIQGSQINSVVGQGRVLGQQIFIVYVNDTWRNIDSCIRLFVEECIIYRKITNKNNIESCERI